jgi:hypothetical protein
VSDQNVTIRIWRAKRNGDFSKNYGVLCRSCSPPALDKSFSWQALMAAIAGALGF